MSRPAERLSGIHCDPAVCLHMNGEGGALNVVIRICTRYDIKSDNVDIFAWWPNISKF